MAACRAVPAGDGVVRHGAGGKLANIERSSVRRPRGRGRQGYEVRPNAELHAPRRRWLAGKAFSHLRERTDHGLDNPDQRISEDCRIFVEKLTVEAGWENAVEGALGQLTEGVLVDSPEALVDALGELGDGRIALVSGDRSDGACAPTSPGP